MPKRIVILTGQSVRHDFMRMHLAHTDGVTVAASYSEGVERSLETFTAKEEDNKLRMQHLHAREQSEEDFFSLYTHHAVDLSHPIKVSAGAINNQDIIDDIESHVPDFILAYGCSIVKGSLLEKYRGRFLNVHLGLSPYYRGAGTNFWPLVNAEPEYVGATFMHIDAGVDTGSIIHQIRARIYWGDTPHTIGNRLIKDVAFVYGALVRNFDAIVSLPAPLCESDKYYKKADYSEKSVETLYRNFKDGLVESYIAEREKREHAVPIVEQPILQNVVLR